MYPCTALEAVRPDPTVCRCQNGGACSIPDGSSAEPVCECADQFSGPLCENFVAKKRVQTSGGVSGLEGSQWVSVRLHWVSVGLGVC